LIQSASNDNQRAYTRLKLAAVLRRLGATPEAAAYFRDLVDLPSNLVDEEGYSFASIAAGGLVSMNTADHDVLKRVARDLATPAALTVDQTLRWQDILAALQNSRDYAVGAEAKMALATISAQLVKLQQIRKDIEQDRDFSDLRNDFRKLTVTERAWTPYGDMLLSRATAGPASRPLIIGVRRERVFAVVRAPHTSGGQFELAVGSGSGEYLDAQRFSDLKIVFPAVGTATESSPNLRRTFYASILLVVSLNLFGGYLLWRDTRREMRVAELRSQFVSSVSHELKTPLTSIRMFAEILQMGNARDEVTNRECLDTIVNESERLTRLLNNVLDFSRIEHGQKTYRMEPTRLADIVAAAAKTMQYPLAEQGFDLRLEVDQQIPTVDADRDALKQAVLNLLTNAMKYSGQSRFIELRLFPQNGDAMIQVVDHGIGIPAGEQSRIFERFYRAPVAENRSISGTGLGLALVAHIAEAHGGSVQVESALGDGSTFSIRIPTHSGGSS
jgi:two-component sensor histidine kinase